MAESRPELEGVTIVLRGAFNPRIFQPTWFSAEDLVRKGEAEAAEIEVIHKDVTIFTMGNFRVQVLEDRFTASTTDAPSQEPLRDLVLATFRLLRHTPIQQMGINSDAHFKVASEQAWHGLGDRLAPKDVWSDVLQQPGMKALVMQGQRPDARSGHIHVRVEPSTKVHPGVFVSVNDHVQLDDQTEPVGAEKMMEVLEGIFDTSIKRAREIALRIVGLA